MKSTPHKVLGHRVRLAQGGWLVVKVVRRGSTPVYRNIFGHDRAKPWLSVETHRERTLWQLERSMRGLK